MLKDIEYNTCFLSSDLQTGGRPLARLSARPVSLRARCAWSFRRLDSEAHETDPKAESLQFSLQVGALWPGAKCTTSLPSRPLRLVVEEVPLLPVLRHELETRLVLVFTGKVRLARNVLQKVVGR